MAVLDVAARLKLNPISPGLIRNGGYIISYTGNLSPGTTLWLGLPDLQHAVDVTKRNQKDLLNATNLPQFLSFIGRQKLWGTQGTCRLFVMRGSTVLEQSNEQRFDCPVRPYVGRLCPELGKGDTGPQLQYTGVVNGRMLYQPAIDGCYYFAYGGKFETDNRMRGLNCITYAGAVFGVDPACGAMSCYGTQLANHLGAQPCDLENKTGQEIKAYFVRSPKGTYLMWSSTHTVIVVNGMVHEFSQGRGGYVSTSIQQWGFGSARYWVRKTLQQF